MARPRIGEEKRASTGIALRVTQEMKDDVDRLAAARKVGIADVVREAIKDYLVRQAGKRA